MVPHSLPMFGHKMMYTWRELVRYRVNKLLTEALTVCVRYSCTH